MGLLTGYKSRRTRASFQERLDMCCYLFHPGRPQGIGPTCWNVQFDTCVLSIPTATLGILPLFYQRGMIGRFAHLLSSITHRIGFPTFSTPIFVFGRSACQGLLKISNRPYENISTKHLLRRFICTWYADMAFSSLNVPHKPFRRTS